EAAADPAAVAVAPAPDDALTVLVADDHPVNRQVMGVLLERLGLPHAFAEDGVEAVEAAASGRFDLVLMDIQMPRMDGFAAAAAIRAFAGDAGAIPIVAVTAHADAEPERFGAAGFDGVVAKPVTADAVARAIAAAAAGRRGVRQ
ncbi:response regulator, partial [Caulobacter sp. 17J65-9]|uniref:response regulator n=1 Tax=Caulobacter sp. 17J65-9 TaxID=2709382 RepID=UPI0013C80F69